MKIIVATAEQMDALPIGSLVRDLGNDVWERDVTGWSCDARDPEGVRRTAEGVFEVYAHAFPGTLLSATELSPAEPEPEHHFRTLVTYEVLTAREAFNGDAEQLGAQVQDGSASATLLDRLDPEEISPAVYRRLVALHDAAGTGFDITEVPSPRLEVLAEVLLEMDQTDANATWVITAEDYKADILRRFAAQNA